MPEGPSPGAILMPNHGCRPADHSQVDRREFLRVGGLSLLGLGLADLLRLESWAGPPSPSRGKPARSVVFIFQSGGPSQHETFDPKPDAPDGHPRRVRHDADATPGRPLLRVPAAAGRAGRPVRHRADDAPSGRPQVPQRAQQLHVPAAHRHDRDAPGRHERHHRPARAPGGSSGRRSAR